MARAPERADPTGTSRSGAADGMSMAAFIAATVEAGTRVSPAHWPPVAGTTSEALRVTLPTVELDRWHWDAARESVSLPALVVADCRGGPTVGMTSTVGSAVHVHGSPRTRHSWTPGIRRTQRCDHGGEDDSEIWRRRSGRARLRSNADAAGPLPGTPTGNTLSGSCDEPGLGTTTTTDRRGDRQVVTNTGRKRSGRTRTC